MSEITEIFCGYPNGFPASEKKVPYKEIEVIPGLWYRVEDSYTGCRERFAVGTPGYYGGLDWCRINYMYESQKSLVKQHLELFPPEFKERVQKYLEEA